MLAKITSKNQITLPKAVIGQVARADYYEVTAENDRIVLTPVRMSRMDEIRRKMNALGITEQDIADAVKWARGKA